MIDFEFDGSDIFQRELLDGVHKTPKARRGMRRKEFQAKIAALKNGKSKGAKGKQKLKIDSAMRQLDKDWHEGMGEDLKEKNSCRGVCLIVSRSRK